MKIYKNIYTFLQFFKYFYITIYFIFMFFVFLKTYSYSKEFSRSLNNQFKDSHFPMILSADQITIDKITSSIIANGNVKIEYNGNKIFAQNVTYDQIKKRIIASENIKIITYEGNILYADYLDLTEDLGEGFIKSLYAETVDKKYFFSENVERTPNKITIFNDGSYTACKICNKKEKYLWKINAKKIIWDFNRKKIKFKDSYFEIFGIPLIKVPYFEIEEENSKRKTGFLTPNFEYQNFIGNGIKNSYFWNLSPNYDFTASETFYTHQGLLLSGEWRHLLKKGYYNFFFSHIYQNNPNVFNYGNLDKLHKNRYMFATTGNFLINSRWSYGWNIFVQSDRNFSKTYNIENYNQPIQRSQIYLKGLSGKNYFDLRLYQFNIQENLLKGSYWERSYKNPLVLPNIHYFFSSDESIFNGELNWTTNFQTIYRKVEDFSDTDWIGHQTREPRLLGMQGINIHYFTELEWKRKFINRYGIFISPILAFREDITLSDNKRIHKNDIYNLYPSYQLRGMITAGLEIRYPLILQTQNTNHIIEPIFQVFIRNNEKNSEHLINEDAQSLVFNTTKIFLRDKFSGYDRMEGGTRVNLGIRYFRNIGDGWSIYGSAGQSYHVSGRNSYSPNNILHLGFNSGLDKKNSDYVASIGINNLGFFLNTQGRFDKKSFVIKRGEVNLQTRKNPIAIKMQYSYIARQPDYGYLKDRKEINFRGIYNLNPNWKINIDTSFDFMSKTLIRVGTSFMYQNQCFEMSFGYLKTQSPGEKIASNKWNFLISFRTIGDFGSKNSFF